MPLKAGSALQQLGLFGGFWDHLSPLTFLAIFVLSMFRAARATARRRVPRINAHAVLAFTATRFERQ